jgi:replicative DNA helicase
MTDLSDIGNLRVPPHSLEAEQSVLGGLLLDNDAWDRCGDILVAGDFYRHEHRTIFESIASLINANKPADVITVFEDLSRAGKASQGIDLSYLNSLAQSVPSAANVRRYAELVRERSILRRLVAVGDEIATAAFNCQGRSVPQILEEAEASVFRIAESGASRANAGTKSMGKLVVQLIDRVNELQENGAEEVTGVRTGLYDFDRMTAGLQPGDLIVLAARPSMGKTALALNIGEHVAVNEGLPVLVFSMEMGAEQLALRLTGSLGRIDHSKLRTGRLGGEEWGRLSEAVEKLGKAEIEIDESSAQTVTAMRSTARRYLRKIGKLGLIVVDYLQLMDGAGARRTEPRCLEAFPVGSRRSRRK